MSELDRLQEVKNGLKKEVEKLIADKEKINEWVAKKEAEVNALSKKVEGFNRKMAEDNSALDQKKHLIDSAMDELRKVEANVARSRGELQYERSTLDGKAKEAADFNDAMKQREKALDAREASVCMREAFLEKVFAGIEALK